MARHTGTMIAWYPPPEVARQLVVDFEGAEPAEALHLTLAYLSAEDNPGLTRDPALARQALEAAVREAASWRSPWGLSGSLGGSGMFPASASSDGLRVAITLVDIPGLAELREALVSNLRNVGFKVASSHGFTPHVTVAYIPPEASPILPVPDSIPVTIEGLTVVMAEERGELIVFEPDRHYLRALTSRALERKRSRRKATRRSLARRSLARVALQARAASGEMTYGSPVEITRADACDMGKRTVGGYLATWDSVEAMNRDGKILDPHCFDASIARHMSGERTVKICDNHSRIVGVWLTLRTDDVGLWGEGWIEETEEGDNVLKKICARSYDALSVGFFALDGYYHETERTLDGERAVVITDADLYEASLTGVPVDPGSKLVWVRALKGGIMPCGDKPCAPCRSSAAQRALRKARGEKVSRGAAVAATLGEKIDVIVSEAVAEDGETLERDDLIEELAATLGFDDDAVSAILAGTVECPDAAMVRRLAEAIGVTEETINAALAEDGCAEEMSTRAADTDSEGNEGAEIEEIPAEAVSMSSGEELLSIASDIEGIASRLRRLAEMADPAEVSDGPDPEQLSADGERSRRSITPPSSQSADRDAPINDLAGALRANLEALSRFTH